MEKNWRLKHPLYYLKRKWIKFQAKTILYPDKPFQSSIGQILFEFQNTKRHRRIFQRTYEYSIQEAIRKFLPKGGTFIDAGANVGFLSAVAADIAGPEGSVHSFEPVPEYFSYLQRLKALNPSYPFFLNNLALDETSGAKKIHIHRSNIGGSSLLNGFIDPSEVKTEIEIHCIRLDSYLGEKGIHPSMIKIDTEGYEWLVLKGCSDYFASNRSSLPPVLVEISKKGLELLGVMPEQLGAYMASFGYKPYCVFGTHRVDLSSISFVEDVLFLV